MMVRVDGKEIPWHEGMTVADVLKGLKHADHYAVVRIEGELISRPDFDRVTVPDDSEVGLLPLIAGG
jgi:thiamine biosynthesis protein ThiS